MRKAPFPMHRRFARLALALPLLLLSACAHVLHVAYTPSTTQTASGAVQLGEFDYLPAAQGAKDRLKINEIVIDDGLMGKMMAGGTRMLDEPVAHVVRKGIEAELLRAGIKPTSPLVLTGAIDAFVPMHGVLYKGLLRVHFTVTDSATGAQVYRKTKEATGVVVYMDLKGYQAILAALIHQCAEQLLTDPEFLQTVRRG